MERTIESESRFRTVLHNVATTINFSNHLSLLISVNMLKIKIKHSRHVIRKM